MRVLITGARGQVGCELMRRVPQGFDVVGMGSTELDIAVADQVKAVVSDVRPQLIINAAAYTAVDKAESDAERAWAVNRDGVDNLAKAAEELAIPLLHISTDYVFSGKANEPYRESDATYPSGVYGASKLGGEEALVANCRQHLILRTSWVFGAHGNNFVKTMLRLGRERDTLSVVADQHGCPTSAASIADALWSLARQYQKSEALQWGVYHFSGDPACTWYQFAEEIFRQAPEMGMLVKVPKLKPIPTTEYPTPAKRPLWSVLGCNRLYDVFGIAQVDWRVELGLVLRELGSP
ncbi:dTDP-4-dehydrorhamnose reductase [Marinobacter sp.]|uniref:dTDP-4-dehydrorhamnose reductase n=1 Tax=Marinobacter sp. TaxID=50741 RepID=UPI003A92D7B0